VKSSSSSRLQQYVKDLKDCKSIAKQQSSQFTQYLSGSMRIAVIVGLKVWPFRHSLTGQFSASGSFQGRPNLPLLRQICAKHLYYVSAYIPLSKQTTPKLRFF
jgi:hypothetical protein